MKSTFILIFIAFIVNDNIAQSIPDYTIKLATETFTPREIKSDEALLSDSSDADVYQNKQFRVIQFRSIPNATLRKEWSNQGLHLMDYFQTNAYHAVIESRFDINSIRDEIRSIINTDDRFRLDAEIYHRGIPDYATVDGGKLHLIVGYYDHLEVAGVLSSLARYGELKGHIDYARQVDLWVDRSQFDKIKSLPFVQFLGTKDPEPELEADFWRGSGRANYLSSGQSGLDFTGDGVTLAIGEGGRVGADDTDYKGRLTEMVTGSIGGHKAGVALRAAGAGNIVPTDRGVAPSADIISVGGSPSYSDLFVSNDLRFTSHSLGYGISGSYSSSARSRDMFVSDYPEGMVQYSAGNSGGSTGYAPYSGFSGWANLTGTRKQFKNNVLAASTNASDQITSFSSRGPTYDGRVAPHLAIEGGGGTSHAAPKMIAAFSVLSEVYSTYNQGMEASSSLLKAVLMNTADDLGTEGIDFKSGYGRVNLRRAHDLINDDHIIEGSIDQMNTNTHTITVPANVKELKVLIYWPDEAAVVNAATALVNDLDLSVQDPASGNHLPWVLDHTANATTLNNPPTRQVDHLNNIEQVTIDNPAAGNYTVNVNGFNVPSGPQNYYVVYEFLEEYIQITDPIKDARIVPGDNYYIYWDAYTSPTSDFTLEYRIEGGAWTTIASGLSAMTRAYNWSVPDLGDGIKAMRVRVSQGTLSNTSAVNTIGDVPQNLGRVSHCIDTLHISWDAVAGATAYKVYVLGDEIMEEQTTNVVFDGASASIGDMSNTENVYYAVSAVTGIYEGRRTNAISSIYEVDLPPSISFSNKSINGCTDETISYQLEFCTDANMNIMASDGFLVSTDESSGFANTIDIAPVGFGYSLPIYVKLDPAVPTSKGVYSGNITHNVAGVDPQILPIEAFEYVNTDDRSGYALAGIENGERLTIEDINWNAPERFTIEWWLKPNATNNYNQQVGNGWGNFLFHSSNSGGFSVGVSNNGSRINSPDGELSLGEWQHIAFVKNGNNFEAFKNGVSVGTAVSSSNVNWSNFNIGQTGGNSINGEIDEFRMWETARTEQEIREHMHLTLDGDETGLKVYLQIVAASGSIVDLSPNCYKVSNIGFTRTNSEAPVAAGVSVTKSINMTGVTSFDNENSDTKLDVDIQDILTGNVTVSHLTAEGPQGEAPPSTTLEYQDEYWIVHDYRAGGSGISGDYYFDLGDEVESTELAAYEVSNRNHNVTSTWSSSATSDEVDVVNGVIKFDQVSESGQLVLSTVSKVDTIPGRSLYLSGSESYAEVPALNLNTNTLTLTTWIKPEGTQNDWAGILFSRSNNTLSGLSLRSNNELRYHWNGVEWDWSSGIYVTPDEWNYVAMVIEPTKVTLYVNGVPVTRNVNHAPEEFDGIIRVGNDATSDDRTFKGEIDEMCLWDRALSEEEIRSLRHLTKDKILDTGPNLKMYLQFNTERSASFDKSGNGANATAIGSVSTRVSNAPLGGGISDMHTVTTPATVNSATGLDLTFGPTGNLPQGDLYFTKINLQPDVLPSNTPVSQSYWIVNNYGTNQTIDAITAISLSDAGNITPATAYTDLSLMQRSDNDFGNLWTEIATADQVDMTTNSATFDQNITINNLGQFVIDNKGAKGWIGLCDTNWHNADNWGEGVVPTAADEVVIPAHTPYQPIVEANAAVKSLTMQRASQIQVLENIIFTVMN